MEIAFWLGKWVAGPLVAIVVGLVFSEPLKERLAPLITRLGSKKEEGVSGLWLATHYYGDPEKSRVEVIQISTKIWLGSWTNRAAQAERGCRP